VSNEWDTLAKISKLLEKFEVANKMMSGAKYPTLSIVMPLFIDLFFFIESRVRVLPDDDPISDVLTLPILC